MNNILETRACRRHASWLTHGETTVYRVPVSPDVCKGHTIMNERLSAIRPSSDGRWNWWRWKSKYHRGWDKCAGPGGVQGVANSKTEAIVKVLEGWQ